ncbi:MAG: DegV family protein [Anaerolineae bacterium]|nr:DegV family protein [Anaerolineae bacterium]
MVAILTDSTCDLPTDLCQQHGILTVPQLIIWGRDTLRDGIDITTDAFYKRLATAEELPSTARPTPHDIASAYRQAREQSTTGEVLFITATSKASGTFASAQEALELVDFPVRILDSQMISMGLGFLVLRAVDLRDQGMTPSEIEALTRSHIPQLSVFFTVATLDFLHRGGRIGRARHLMGRALQIKPILQLQEGQVGALESVRTRARALKRLVELAEERLLGSAVVHLAVMHGDAPQEAQALAEDLRQRLAPARMLHTTISPSIGVHAGPGVVGLAMDLSPFSA